MNRSLVLIAFAAVFACIQSAQSQEIWPTVRPVSMQRDELTIPLADSVQDVAVGAAGRMLILRLKGQPSLTIVDLQALRVVGSIPLPWPTTLFAANVDSVVVVDASEGRAERWSLKTLNREAEGQIDATLPIGTIAMGSASRGPLLAMPENCRWPLDEVLLFDPQTFQPSVEEIELEGRNVRQFLKPNERQYANAAANGLLFHTAPTQFVVRFQGVAASGTYYRRDDDQRPILLPGPLAHTFYGLEKPLNFKFEPLPWADGKSPGAITIPDRHGPFFLRCNVDNGAVSSITAHLAGTVSAGVPLSKLDISSITTSDSLPIWKRIHLISAAHLIAVCDPEQPVLRLLRFVPEQILKATGKPYLAVVSQPASFTQTGRTFHYAMHTLSSGQGVKYELQEGPDGAGVNSDGQIEWNVGSGFADPLVAFSIDVSDDQGLVRRHRFEVRVFGADPENAQRQSTLLTELQPVTDTMQIVPPKLSKTPTVIPLKSSVSSVAVGGGGRFLVLKIVGQVAVFDVNQAAVVGYVPLPNTKCLVTAGAECLVIFDPDTSTMERWSLADLSLEKSNQLQVNVRLSALTMGSAAKGPILLGSPVSNKDLAVIDGDTLEPLPSMVDSVNHGSIIPDQVRVSADGRLVTAWRTSVRPNGFWLLTRQGNRFTTRFEPISCGSLLPSADARYVLTSSGVFTRRLRSAGFGESGHVLIPAVRGAFYLAFRPPNPLDRKSPPQVTLHTNGKTRELAELPTLLPVVAESPTQRVDRNDLDRRLWFIPAAKLVIQLSGINNQLTLYRIDVDALLEQFPGDYLFVNSAPPLEATPGREWSYQVSVRSNRGDVNFRLAVGPNDMRIDDSGRMSWQVPSNSTGGTQHVVLAVQDAGDQEILHAFDIFVSD